VRQPRREPAVVACRKPRCPWGGEVSDNRQRFRPVSASTDSRPDGAFGWLHPPCHSRFEGLEVSPPRGKRFPDSDLSPTSRMGGCNHRPGARPTVQSCSNLGTKPLYHRRREVSYLGPFPGWSDEWTQASIGLGADTNNLRNEPNGPISNRKLFRDGEIRWTSPFTTLVRSS
jgi:hypothetical protein